jgi:hypothetical protein
VSDQHRGTWRIRAAARESVVIIASILIAFSIDAWWDTHADTVQSEALLSALADDMDGTRAELERVRTMHAGISESSARIMRWAQSDDPLAACQAEEDPYAFLLAHPTIDPPLGALQAILGSGRADLIEDRALLRELTRFAAVVSDLEREEARANAHLASEVYPFLRDALDLKTAVRSGGYMWEDLGDAPVPCEPALSRTFQSIIYYYWSYHEVILRESIPTLAESVEVVSSLLEANGYP